MLNRMVQDYLDLLRSPEGPGSAAGESAESGTVESQSGSSDSDSTTVTTKEDTSDTMVQENDFGAMDESFESIAAELDELDGAEAPVKPAAAKPAATETKPAAKPGEKPAAAAPVDPNKPIEPAKVEPAAKPGEEPAATPVKPQSFSEVLIASEKNVVPELAKLYSIPEEMSKHFTADQQPALKQMAAMVHFNVLRAAAAMIENLTPAMIDRHQAQTTVQNQGEQEFFTAWPQLNKPEHRATIVKYGKMYHAANPNIDRATYIKTVGLMAAAELGLVAAQVAAAPAPGAKAAPVKHAFAPANVTGRQSIPMGPSGTGTDWGLLAEQDAHVPDD